jgi:hypothetical protein
MFVSNILGFRGSNASKSDCSLVRFGTMQSVYYVGVCRSNLML